jgi:hypothetical protein
VHPNCSAVEVVLSLPGAGMRTVRITGLLPSTAFTLEVTGRPASTVRSDQQGATQFTAEVRPKDSIPAWQLTEEPLEYIDVMLQSGSSKRLAMLWAGGQQKRVQPDQLQG